MRSELSTFRTVVLLIVRSSICPLILWLRLALHFGSHLVSLYLRSCLSCYVLVRTLSRILLRDLG